MAVVNDHCDEAFTERGVCVGMFNSIFNKCWHPDTGNKGSGGVQTFACGSYVSLAKCRFPFAPGLATDGHARQSSPQTILATYTATRPATEKRLREAQPPPMRRIQMTESPVSSNPSVH
jgi:hypothetical protein